MALNALLEPRKIQPKITSRATVKSSALRGSSSFGWTLAKNLENGRPPSLRRVSMIQTSRQFAVNRFWGHQPGKSPRHATGGRHDTSRSEKKAHQGESKPVRYLLLGGWEGMLLTSISR